MGLQRRSGRAATISGSSVLHRLGYLDSNVDGSSKKIIFNDKELQQSNISSATNKVGSIAFLKSLGDPNKNGALSTPILTGQMVDAWPRCLFQGAD